MTFVESVLVYGHMLHPSRVVFFPGAIFKLPPELWRLMTSFLLTGPKLSFLFDLYFSTASSDCFVHIELTRHSVHIWKSIRKRICAVHPGG